SLAIGERTALYQSSQIDCKCNEMAIIQGGHRVINKHILKTVEFVSNSVSYVGFIQCGHELLEKSEENAPDKITLFALGYLYSLVVPLSYKVLLIFRISGRVCSFRNTGCHL